MAIYRVHNQKRKIVSLIAVALLSLPCIVHADDRVDTERSKLMTVNLIEALVDSGVITREKADKLIADAEEKAQAKIDALPGPQFKSRFAQAPTPAYSRTVAQAAPDQTANSVAIADPAMIPVVAPTAAQLAAPILATIPQTNTPDVGVDGKRIVHVAYIPEATKTEMREQIKQEVIAQSKAERWGDPGALPDWLNRVSVSGDVRVRNEYIKLSPSNTAAGAGYTDGVFTRAANIVGGSLGGTLSPFDTQNNYDFWNVRARLNIDAKLTDMVSTGLSLSTGNTNQRTSTSQNLGTNFNYYSVVIDKAFIKVDPFSWLSVSGGRIDNPFFGTDLLWADDLNFEGVAVKTKFNVSPTFKPFVTAGWFPIRMDSPGTSTARTLAALQAGFDWAITPKTQFKFGTSIYNYIGMAAQAETNVTQATSSDYVSRYEYPAGFRQMGNTLFIINAPDDTNVNWGLASKFKEINLTASLDIARFDPFHVIFVSDYVKNISYNVNDIFARTGYMLVDGKNTGYQEKILIGSPVMKERGNWNMSLAYRYLGSDAVLDAFTNPDFGLGSTNTKGFIFTGNYGLDKNTWITGRYLSSNLIDSMVPQAATLTTMPTKLGVDMIQVEINARY